MALLTEIERQGDVGIKKEIDSSALSIILDLVQSNQYQYPIPSTVREVTSNGVDSIKEKNMAIAILSGEKTVEDYFVIREGGIYDGSNFDPSYYDLRFLASDDTVYITLKENESKRDILSIRDYGVGLGGKRLEKYFQIGFSSKRNLKTALGKFGIGAKAPLSVNSFFNITSVYNGVCFEFLVYSDRVVSTVPAFDLMAGVPNEQFVFSDGSIIYGKKSSEDNNVLIEVETKKHQRAQVIDAVKTSLMYFKDVEFNICNENDDWTAVPIQADVIFEDDDILVSQNNRYSKPHLVMNNVNYGYLDFIEMEMEAKMGPIGIKMDPDQVDVNPSRESVIWSDKTRASVLAKFSTVQEIASRMVSQQLESETDYLRWSIKCASVLTKGVGSHGVLGALSGVIDTSQIKPVFPGEVPYPWSSNATKQFADWKLFSLDMNNGRTKREACPWSSYVMGSRLFVQDIGGYSFTTDAYLLSPQGQSLHTGYVYIAIRPSTDVTRVADLYSEEDASVAARADLMSLSLEITDHYSGIQVPADFAAKSEEDEEENIKVEKEKGLSLAAIRKINKQITYRRVRPYGHDQQEVTIANIPDMNPNLVYGSSEEKPMLTSLHRILYSINAASEFPILLLSQGALPYFATSKFTHVKDWFHRFDNGHLTTHPYLVGWNTCRLLKQQFPEGKLADLAFLNNFTSIDQKIAADYKAACTYMYYNLKNHKSGYEFKGGFPDGMVSLTMPYLEDELGLFLSNLAEFQVTGPTLDEEGKKELSMKLFGNDKVTSAYGYDEVETNRLKSMLEQTTPYRVMVSSITQLTDRSEPISQDLEMEIKNYIAFKQGQ